MHNRLRMVVAMFLTKHLLIDWRWGERFFMQKLVDGDFSSNNGGWQWAASTGSAHACMRASGCVVLTEALARRHGRAALLPHLRTRHAERALRRAG
jgi:hypothetical protein